MQIIPQTNSVWNKRLDKSNSSSNSSCKLYHKPTRFETLFKAFFPSANTVANYTTNQLGLKRKAQELGSLVHKVANYTTNQLGLKHHIATSRLTLLDCVANYTANQLGLKPSKIYRWKSRGSLCCKLYHKPTRFETRWSLILLLCLAELQIIPQTNSVWNKKQTLIKSALIKVANYTTNQLGLKRNCLTTRTNYFTVANYTTNQLGLKLW